MKQKGHRHPIHQTIREMVDIFTSIGYTIAQGPEKETEFFNFDALNIPPHHPARDMWDTFWVKNEEHTVMRTHTSPMQVRYLREHGAPCSVIVPGKVFRNEATDTTHEAQFYQLEGFSVGKNISMTHLLGVLEYFLQQYYGKDVSMRVRPSHFPFTEPSIEVDVVLPDGTCLEILGAGMIHPYVLRQSHIDPDIYSAFAFGLGIDRLTKIKHSIDDIRLFYQGDMRLINQL